MTLSLSPVLPPANSGPDQVRFCQMVVGKALLNSRRTKEISEGQLALESFLARKRQKYQTRRKGLAKECVSTSCEETLNSSKHDSIGTSFTKDTKESLFMHERNCMIRLASISVPSMNDGTRAINHSSPKARATKLRDFSQLDCEELAHHVVSQAKVRLRRRKKAANVLQKLYKPVLNSNQSRPPMFRTSTPANSKSSTPHLLSPSKQITEAREVLNKSLDLESGSEHRQGLKPVRRVVNWSEKQSTKAKDSGIPCVPPSSPEPTDSCHEDLKFVPSMSDTKSQRKLKSRLQAISDTNQENENKELVLKMERERRDQKEAITRLKVQQRAEIYALNKVMAEFERLKFESMMTGKV